MPEDLPTSPAGAAADAEAGTGAGTDAGVTASSLPDQTSSFQEIGATPGALHTAALAGTVETVRFLLNQKADPSALDSDGRTALQIAEAAKKEDIAQVLREVTGVSVSSAAPTDPLADTSTMSNKGPSVQEPAPTASTTDPGFSTDNVPPSPAKPLNKSQSAPTFDHYADLKAKTAFSGCTTDGVHKSTTFMTQHSSYRHSPKWSLASRGASMFVRSSQSPAPGTYAPCPEEKWKFKAQGNYSFGGSSRFGLGPSPTKKSPGPGAHDPSDPNHHVDAKVGFGTSQRTKLTQGANPGPGAYESTSCLGEGRMFTARGRQPVSYMRARSMPGPGAYTPSTNAVYGTAPKTGFGTSTRDDVGARMRNLLGPGPGTYELQNFKTLGADGPKYSATSRRRLNDLNSYVQPGPGTYNAHVTQFGY